MVISINAAAIIIPVIFTLLLTQQRRWHKSILPSPYGLCITPVRNLCLKIRSLIWFIYLLLLNILPILKKPLENYKELHHLFILLCCFRYQSISKEIRFYIAPLNPNDYRLYLPCPIFSFIRRTKNRIIQKQ